MFVCPRCSYTTPERRRFIQHINRKTLCLPSTNNVCLDSLREQYAKTESNFTCEKCSKIFKHQSSLSRHKTTCKSHQVLHDHTNPDIIKILYEMKQEIQKLHANHGGCTNNISNNNQNITINITNFGSENTKHLEESFLTQCFLEKNIVDIIEKIHLVLKQKNHMPNLVFPLFLQMLLYSHQMYHRIPLN